MLSKKRILLAWLLTIACLLTHADAQDFRVDTELFQNQDKKPFLETLTIFCEGKVYDFCLTEPRETTVVDLSRGHISLLDETRRVRAAVTTQELLDFSLALEAVAAQQNSSLFAFCAAPKFDTTESTPEQSGRSLTDLRLEGKPLTYVARGEKPESAGAAKLYRQFADWCARVNSARGGNLPAGARLALNQALAERDLLPLEVTRTTSEPLGRKLELRSQHRFNWALCGEDRKRMERVGDQLATFQTVSFDEYRGAKAKPADAKHARK